MLGDQKVYTSFEYDRENAALLGKNVRLSVESISCAILHKRRGAYIKAALVKHWRPMKSNGERSGKVAPRTDLCRQRFATIVAGDASSREAATQEETHEERNRDDDETPDAVPCPESSTATSSVSESAESSDVHSASSNR